MFNLLGMKPEEIITQAQSAVKALEEKLTCLEDRLAAIQRTLEYEYGRPVRDVQAHDPRNLPFVVQIAAGRVDLQAGLGKLATRGHIANIGDNPAHLYFETRGKRVGPYTLVAGAALDLSFALEVLEVQADTSGATIVQVFAQ